MVTARLLDRPFEEGSTGLGDYEFAELPRSGELIRLYFKNSEEQYRVVGVEHHFHDHTKTPLVAVLVTRVDKPRGPTIKLRPVQRRQVRRVTVSR